MTDSCVSPVIDHLPRVHDAAGVEDALELAHEVELECGRVALELAALEPADAVLGADAAAHARHDVVDDAVELLSARLERLGVRTRRPAQIEVHVAVAHVAEGEHADPGLVRSRRRHSPRR